MRSRHLTRFLQLGYHGEMNNHEPRTGFAFAKVQEHVEELRRFFDLPPDELFLDEFYCALYKRILLQGRMYIFEHYLCFYSNVFGWVKRKVIPLREVTEVTKKRNYGFPNSIEVVWRKKEFFTSFLNRTNAFTLLCEAVTHVRESSSPSSSVESPSTANLPSISDAKQKLTSRGSTQIPRRGSSHEKGSENGEEDSDLEEYDEEFDIWNVIPGGAPLIPENMEILREDHYDVSVQEFFRRTLSLESMFLYEYHKRRGDSRYTVSRWEQLHEISGSVRQATFVSPVKGVRGIGFMSPKTTICNQDHRLRIYSGDHLVFEISQVMKDIPYGDNFSVEIRWDVVPDETTGCRISIHVAVPFIRSVMAPFRSIIESNVMKEMQDSVKMMSEMLKDTMCLPEEGSETTTQDNNPVHLDEKQTDVPSQVLEKLRTFLSNEEGMKRLEKFLNSPDSVPERAPFESNRSSSLHQNTTTMNIQSSPVSSTNWILFCSCFFLLFCQIMLFVLWLVFRSPVTGLPSSNSNPYLQLLDMEQTLASLVQILNSTVMETTPPS